MLWKKESGTYVDLLKNVKFVPKILRLHRPKNNSLALKKRMQGNEKFHQNGLEEAMALYNESICLAESNSEHLSFGYANRSNCFLKMRLYDQCLVDIQLAKDTGYPETLMVKLETRKRECQKSLQAGSKNHQKLNIQVGDKLPWMSMFLQHDEKYAKGVTANKDIQVGQTLLMEESYVHMMHTDETNYCSFCWEEKMNFIPCRTCADAMFCSRKCASNNVHESECEIAIHFEDHIDGESSIFILRSVIIGINTFLDVKEMMEFVEESILREPFEINESTEKSKYRTFLKLPSDVSNQRILDLRRKAYIIFNAVMQSKLAAKFQKKETQRFLVHLIVCHTLILRSNSFMGPTQNDHDGTRFTQKLDLLASSFNHSCLPNVIHLNEKTLTIIKTILPIKRGDAILIAYINCDDYKINRERKRYLQKVYGFRCKCQLCTVGILNSVEQERDPNFNFIAENILKLNENFDVELASDIKNRCANFLMKFQDMVACKESLFISNSLGDVLRLELSNVK